MKTDKEQLIDALLLTIIYYVLSVVMQFGGMEILSIIALVVQILAINKFIRYAIDKSDFKMSRFAFIGTFVASTAMVIYTMQIVGTYVGTALDPSLVVTENKGILVMVFISMVIAQSVTYFLTQGCAGICRNEINNHKLTTLFDNIKYIILGFMVLGLIASFSSILEQIHSLLTFAYQALLLFGFWQLRQALITSVNE